jgi:hypothetical protein
VGASERRDEGGVESANIGLDTLRDEALLSRVKRLLGESLSGLLIGWTPVFNRGVRGEKKPNMTDTYLKTSDLVAIPAKDQLVCDSNADIQAESVLTCPSPDLRHSSGLTCAILEHITV